MKYITALLFIFILFFVCTGNSYSLSLMGDWNSGEIFSVIILDEQEVNEFSSLPIEQGFEKSPGGLEKVRDSFASGTAKAIIVDVKIKNIWTKPVETGYCPSMSGRGSFSLISESGVYQDCANRNEFSENLSLNGVILLGRRMLNLGESFLPEGVRLAPGETIRGRLLFLVPKNFKPEYLIFNEYHPVNKENNQLEFELKWQ